MVATVSIVESMWNLLAVSVNLGNRYPQKQNGGCKIGLRNEVVEMTRKKEAKLKSFSMMQYLYEGYWDWTDEEKKELASQDEGPWASKDTRAIGQIMVDRLTAAGGELAQFHAIIHDKDLKENDEVKPFHIHAVGVFEPGKGLDIHEIATALGIGVNFCEKPKKGPNNTDNPLSYLIHIKDEDKHQYRPDEVVSWGMPYMEIYQERYNAWMRGRSVKTRQKAEANLDHVVEQALMGQITKSDIMEDPMLYKTWAHSKNEVEDALASYGERRSAMAVKQLENGDFTKNTIVMTGEEGLGKSKYAFAMAREICERGSSLTGQRWRYFSAADRHSLDDYAGEEVLIFDDQDGSGLTGSAWKTLLAPTEANPVGARYRNKGAIAPRVMIITTTMTSYELAAAMRGGSGAQSRKRDPIGQYLRRFEYELKMDRVVASASTEDKDALLSFTAKLLSRLDEEIEPVIDIREVNGSDRHIREKTNWGWQTFMVTTDQEVMLGVMSDLGMMQRGKQRDELIGSARNYSQDMSGYITTAERDRIRIQKRLDEEARQLALEPSVWDAVGHTAY